MEKRTLGPRRRNLCTADVSCPGRRASGWTRSRAQHESHGWCRPTRRLWPDGRTCSTLRWWQEPIGGRQDGRGCRQRQRGRAVVGIHVNSRCIVNWASCSPLKLRVRGARTPSTRRRICHLRMKFVPHPSPFRQNTGAYDEGARGCEQLGFWEHTARTLTAERAGALVALRPGTGRRRVQKLRETVN